MTFRTEDDLVQEFRKSTRAEVEADTKRICKAVNFDGLTTPEAEMLWTSFFHGHGWSYCDYQEVDWPKL